MHSLGSNTTASDNTAVGRSTLANTTTGANNVAVGRSALALNTTGTENTAVGANAADSMTTGNYNTAVGKDTLNVATTGNYNTAVGISAGNKVTTGGNHTLMGQGAGGQLTTASNCLILGYDAGQAGSPGGANTTGSGGIFIGDENVSDAYVQVDWTIASDQRDKTDFTALDLGLDFVKALAPVTYKWDKRSKYGDKTAADYDLNAQTPDGTHKEDWLDIGFKAQEVEALEIAAGYNKDNKTNLTTTLSNDGKQYGIQYSKFVPILVKAIQEQNALIEALTTRITTLEG
jgi:hypothetical protein